MNKQDEFQKTIDKLNAGIKALPELIELVDRIRTNHLLEASGVAGVTERRHKLHADANEAMRLASEFKSLIGHTIYVDFLEREDDDPEFAYVSMVYIDHPNDIEGATRIGSRQS